MSEQPLRIHIDNTIIGKCGRCGTGIRNQYVWCDHCEDIMVRISPQEWIERLEKRPENLPVL